VGLPARVEPRVLTAAGPDRGSANPV